MPWLILIVSALFEAVWATALSASDGLSQLVPTVIFVLGMIISLGGLAYAMKTIPLGVAYAIWVGIGAALTVTVAMVTGEESVSFGKIVFIVGIIGAVIGLKVVDPHPREPSAEDASTAPGQE